MKNDTRQKTTTATAPAGILEDSCPGCGSDLSALGPVWACVGRCGESWLPGEVRNDLSDSTAALELMEPEPSAEIVIESFPGGPRRRLQRRIG